MLFFHFHLISLRPSDNILSSVSVCGTWNYQHKPNLLYCYLTSKKHLENAPLSMYLCFEIFYYPVIIFTCNYQSDQNWFQTQIPYDWHLCFLKPPWKQNFSPKQFTFVSPSSKFLSTQKTFISIVQGLYNPGC